MGASLSYLFPTDLPALNATTMGKLKVGQVRSFSLNGEPVLLKNQSLHVTLVHDHSSYRASLKSRRRCQRIRSHGLARGNKFPRSVGDLHQELCPA